MIELNKCYCLDNLELMKQIDDNKIDLIYCDILYGTGRKFKDYTDLKPDRKIIDDFYIPRIKEMHRILKDTGNIFLHMDYRIVHWIRCIMDDIFGYNNFVNEIIWSYKNGGASKSSFSKKHDNILFYSKTNKSKYNNIKEKSYVNKSKGYNPYTERFNDENGDYVLTNPIDVWDIQYINAHDKTNRVGYDTQKPEKLLEKIILAGCDKGDIVADFFCGSGTTGVVAKQLDRQYILCDINSKAIKISEERLSNINVIL